MRVAISLRFCCDVVGTYLLAHTNTRTRCIVCKREEARKLREEKVV